MLTVTHVSLQMQMTKTRMTASQTHAPTGEHALTAVTGTTLAHAHQDIEAHFVKQVIIIYMSTSYIPAKVWNKSSFKKK